MLVRRQVAPLATGELAEPVAAVVGLAQLGTNGRKSRDEAAHGPTKAASGSREGQNKTPGPLTRAGGFNLINLAEPVGFEPTVGSHPHNFSRVAPSAARTRFRGRS